jgi:hypothetical protein
MRLLEQLYDELVEYIDGPFVVGAGGLLGLYREGKLIDYDEDIDIFLLPNTKINIPEDSHLQINQYYMDHKVSYKNGESNKINRWKDYVSYIRTQNIKRNLNRCELLKLASNTYASKSMDAKFTKPYMDIYHLNELDDRYVIDNWPEYFKREELETIDNIGKYPVPKFDLIPNYLRRMYGVNWRIPDANFQHN